MRIKITCIFLVTFTLLVSAQDQIPSKHELLGDWELVLKNHNLGETKYILSSGKNPTRVGLHQQVKKSVSQKRELPKDMFFKNASCSNDYRLRYNRVYGKHKTPIVYNRIEGVLEISSDAIFGDTLFVVRKLDYGNILLTLIE